MQRRARASRLPNARRRPIAVRPTAARRRRVSLPTWHGLRPPRLAAPAVMGPRTNPSPTACCARHLSDRARIAPTRPARVLPARGAVPRRAHDRSAAYVSSHGHGGECDDNPRDALPRRRLRRAGVCAHPLRPSHAPPRTHSTPTRVACGDTWRHVAIRGDAWHAQGLLHRATVDGDEGETLRSGKTNAAVIAESAVQASRRARYTRVYTWHAPLRPRHVS